MYTETEMLIAFAFVFFGGMAITLAYNGFTTLESMSEQLWNMMKFVLWGICYFLGAMAAMVAIVAFIVFWLMSNAEERLKQKPKQTSQ